MHNIIFIDQCKFRLFRLAAVEEADPWSFVSFGDGYTGRMENRQTCCDSHGPQPKLTWSFFDKVPWTVYMIVCRYIKLYPDLYIIFICVCMCLCVRNMYNTYSIHKLIIFVAVAYIKPYRTFFFNFVKYLQISDWQIWVNQKGGVCSTFMWLTK